MTALARESEEILATALKAGSQRDNLMILIDRQGQMRMLDPSGWTALAAAAEFGAARLFQIRRNAQEISVEGWAGLERCRVSQPVRSQTLPAPAAAAIARSSSVWNA